MIYEKPNADIILFENSALFMAASETNPSSAQEALAAACGGYGGGGTNNFSCTDFGGFNADNPPYQGATVPLAGGTYVFDYVGNHWKCSVVSK